MKTCPMDFVAAERLHHSTVVTRLKSLRKSWASNRLRASLRACSPLPAKVGRAVLSAPRPFKMHSNSSAFVNSIGALGTARPTFRLSFHLRNTLLPRLLLFSTQTLIGL